MLARRGSTAATIPSPEADRVEKADFELARTSRSEKAPGRASGATVGYEARL
jgi:hypothetical protein